MTLDELSADLKKHYGKGVFHATALYREYFRKGNTLFATMPEFANSPGLLQKLAEDIGFPVFKISSKQENEVVKFATTFSDEAAIESVIIPAKNRNTLCVSSQAGCKMNCAFCATGANGFARNLSVEEIVVQVWAAIFSFGKHIDNVVFMGMGEPLDNIKNVVQAIRVMTDVHGLNIPQKSITISTAGNADRIRDLGLYGIPHVRLAISLNAPNNTLRDKLMPINRQFSLKTLKESLINFPLGKKGVFLIEYVLLAGVNDSREMAEELADYLTGLPVRVNLIAFNEYPSCKFTTPSNAAVRQFASWLVERKLFVRVRNSSGAGISAACGQLTSASRLRYATNNIHEASD